MLKIKFWAHGEFWAYHRSFGRNKDSDIYISFLFYESRQHVKWKHTILISW